jgi:hypothetical protein
MSKSKIELYQSQLKRCRAETLKIAGGVPERRRLAQLKDGKAHPLWLLGHLANTMNVVCLQWVLEKESLTPKGFGKKFAPDFGGGAPITPNPPGWDEVAGVYDQVLSAAIDNVSALSDEDLPLPLKGRIPEPLREFFISNEFTLTQMVIHDSYHRGQIGLLGKLVE